MRTTPSSSCPLRRRAIISISCPRMWSINNVNAILYQTRIYIRTNRVCDVGLQGLLLGKLALHVRRDPYFREWTTAREDSLRVELKYFNDKAQKLAPPHIPCCTPGREGEGRGTQRERRKRQETSRDLRHGRTTNNRRDVTGPGDPTRADSRSRTSAFLLAVMLASTSKNAARVVRIGVPGVGNRTFGALRMLF